MSYAQTKLIKPESGLDSWLRDSVVPALKAYKTTPNNVRTSDQVGARLRQEIERRK
ncbi:hypothetical protein ABW286_22785 [Erwinia papayae]|uniref:Uncharacterized protein n=1 Tax=Erwinia papayae TaxID=206499 RepID=A0ABV3N812_9GAMM